MTMMGSNAGRAMDPTVKPMVTSVKTGKVFVVLKQYDDLVSGERYVFIARPRQLNDMRRVKRDKFERLFLGFNEPIGVTDARVAWTDEDFQAALFEEPTEEEKQAQEQAPAPDTTVTGDASAPTQPVTPPETPKKRRGRPKGSKNKKTLEREAAEAKARDETAARAAGVLPQPEGETEEAIQQQSADTTLGARAL